MFNNNLLHLKKKHLYCYKQTLSLLFSLLTQRSARSNDKYCNLFCFLFESKVAMVLLDKRVSFLQRYRLSASLLFANGHV